MVMDKRVVAVLDAIVNEPGITAISLEKQFFLTRKQLSYTLQKVNDYLESHHFDRINRLKTGKLNVSRHVIEYFRRPCRNDAKNRYLFSEDERRQIIYFLLLTRSECLSLLHLSSFLKVSQNTVINDLKKARSEVAEYYLEINYSRRVGYHIEGEELDKRYLLLECLRRILKTPTASTITPQFKGALDHYIVSVGHMFSEIEKRFKIQFTDIQLQELIYFISIILHRISRGKKITKLPANYAAISSSRDFLLMQDIVNRFDIDSQKDLVFITALIQSSNIQTTSDKYFHLDAVLLESVVATVDNFEKISCVTIREKNELIEKIYQHWKPACHRIRYHLSNSNSVHELVVKEFGHLQDIVKRAVSPLEAQLNCEIPEEEMAFLTVLFGGWLTREGIIHQVKLQKKALVVCENSATIAAYLFLTLQVLLPELYFIQVISRREFERYSGHYDVVFSTSHLVTSQLLFIIDPASGNIHKKVFRDYVIDTLQGVDPNIIQIERLLIIFEQFGNINDYSGLQRALANYIYDGKSTNVLQQPFEQYMPSLAILLSKQHIHFCNDRIYGWPEVIEIASASLLQDEIIEQRYIDAMIKKIEEEQPWIMLAEGVIIAHAGVEDGVQDTGMALLRLTEKVNFADYIQADIIIVLATHNPQKHLSALAQLNELLEFHHGAERIRQAKNDEDIINILSVYK